MIKKIKRENQCINRFKVLEVSEELEKKLKAEKERRKLKQFISKEKTRK